jgi:hypothetical protein
MVTDMQAVLDSHRNKLLRALKHLEYSHARVASLDTDLTHLSEQELAEWESYTARFARAAEIFLQRYLRTWVLMRDPGFSGSFRDFLNVGHKLGLIDSPETWLAIREMRNRMAHEYEDTRLKLLFEEVRSRTPFVLQLSARI